MEINRQKIIEVVLEAGEILKKYFYSDSLVVYQKEGVDYTTEADREVDAFLIEKLKALYPETEFLTEETSSGDYSFFLDKDNLWVIDPLDGTVNFSRKNPHFSISVALVNKGQPVLGIVYLPMLNDLYFADEIGAFLNQKLIHVSSVNNLRELVLACDWSWDLEKRKEVVKWLSNINSNIRQIKSMGSAVADLASLAEGKIDVYIHSGTKPWDVAASSLIIRRAGGEITDTEGGEWNIFNPGIVASNKIIHKEIIKIINKGTD
ncbi:MAG: inositol monophosphatase family protein [Candidatus Paceibacterota bacterium]|jgi:myo-inositol-1(or 4)-monophosphatase